MSDVASDTESWRPSGDRDHHRRTGELTAWEFLRWAWRQLTSMRTALILLLLLALGAIPGSVIPQSGVDALKTQNWQAAHPTSPRSTRSSASSASTTRRGSPRSTCC